MIFKKYVNMYSHKNCLGLSDLPKTIAIFLSLAK